MPDPIILTAEELPTDEQLEDVHGSLDAMLNPPYVLDMPEEWWLT